MFCALVNVSEKESQHKGQMSKANTESYILRAGLHEDGLLLQIKCEELAEKDNKTIPQIPHFRLLFI